MKPLTTEQHLKSDQYMFLNYGYYYDAHYYYYLPEEVS